MTPAQSQSAAVAGARIGSNLVGHWTLEVNPPGRVIPEVSQTVLAQASFLNSAGGQLLRCRWALQ